MEGVRTSDWEEEKMEGEEETDRTEIERINC